MCLEVIGGPARKSVIRTPKLRCSWALLRFPSPVTVPSFEEEFERDPKNPLLGL